MRWENAFLSSIIYFSVSLLVVYKNFDVSWWLFLWSYTQNIFAHLLFSDWFIYIKIFFHNLNIFCSGSRRATRTAGSRLGSCSTGTWRSRWRRCRRTLSTWRNRRWRYSCPRPLSGETCWIYWVKNNANWNLFFSTIICPVVLISLSFHNKVHGSMGIWANITVLLPIFLQCARSLYMALWHTKVLKSIDIFVQKLL